MNAGNKRRPMLLLKLTSNGENIHLVQRIGRILFAAIRIDRYMIDYDGLERKKTFAVASGHCLSFLCLGKFSHSTLEKSSKTTIENFLFVVNCQ